VDYHQEKKLKDAKDTQLLRKMLLFAKPYWKPIVISILLGALISVTALIQPLLVQTAIDDRINGLHKPMVRISEQESEPSEAWFAVHERKLTNGTSYAGATYYRLKNDNLTKFSDQLGSVAEPIQIMTIDRERYMVEGWLPEGVSASKDVDIVPHNDGYHAVFNGESYSAVHLTNEDVQLFRASDYTGFVVIACVFFVVVAGGALLNYTQMNMLQNTGQRVIFDIREKMFQHLSRMHTGYFDRNPVGRLVTRVSHDVEALNQLYSQVIVNLVKEITLIIGIIGTMFYLSVKLTLISLTVIPLLVFITIYYRTIVREAHRYTRTVLSRLNSFLAENLSGMRIIQIFNREQKQLDSFDEMNNEYYRAGMRATTINSIFNPTIGFLGNVALAVLIWYGGGSVIQGMVTIGVLFAFTQYIQQFYKPLMGLADRYNQIQTAMASAERIFELLEETPEIVNKADARKLPVKIQGAIEFDDVSFAYNEGEWVLKNIAFQVKPGETIAFVGATGAGKSSIINLLTRFYDVQKGAVRIEGHDVRDLQLDDLRKHVAMIQQDAFVFTGSVYDNIRMNRTDLTDEEVRQVAQNFQMDAFIESLPDGYDTPLGEQGVNLSSGQQQLLSFLRAAVFQPDILILDEATANIDTETELIVQRALEKISAGRTTLIVAHRLSTIQHADKIIVLHKGEIQEIGNHDQLLQEKGYYYRLYEVQNKDRETMRSHA